MKSSWHRKLPAKRSIKPNAGQSKNPKDDTHLRGGERGFLTRDFKIATVPAPLRCRCLRRLLHHLTWTTNCSKCFRRLISITFKLRFRFWFFNFTVFFQVVCVKTGATCSSLAFSLPTDANSMHFLAENEAKLISQPTTTTTRHMLQLDGQLGDGDDLQSWLSRSAHSSQLTWLV